MGAMKVVTTQAYLEKLNANKEESYQLELKAWQVPILHGLVALSADHPGVKKLSGLTTAFIVELRDWCKDVFSQWGFSPEEVEYLDKMREQNSAEGGQDDQKAGA